MLWIPDQLQQSDKYDSDSIEKKVQQEKCERKGKEWESKLKKEYTEGKSHTWGNFVLNLEIYVKKDSTKSMKKKQLTSNKIYLTMMIWGDKENNKIK